MYVHIYVYVYIYIHVYAHKHIHAYIYIYVYCWLFPRLESILHSPTLARSRIAYLTLSSIAHGDPCPDLAPCLSGFRQHSTYFAITGLVRAPRNLPCVPLAVLCASILNWSSAPALLFFLYCAGNLWSDSTLGRRQLAFVCCARMFPAEYLHRSCAHCPNLSL